MPSNVGKVEVTHVAVTNNYDNDQVSGIVNSDQNPCATNKNINELIDSKDNDNDTRGKEMPKGNKNKSSCPKPTLKKSVKLILKNPM